MKEEQLSFKIRVRKAWKYDFYSLDVYAVINIVVVFLQLWPCLLLVFLILILNSWHHFYLLSSLSTAHSSRIIIRKWKYMIFWDYILIDNRLILLTIARLSHVKVVFLLKKLPFWRLIVSFVPVGRVDGGWYFSRGVGVLFQWFFWSEFGGTFLVYRILINIDSGLLVNFYL